MAPSRFFLGTAEPFPQLAAKRLLQGFSGLPDLGNIIITVPGTFAGTALQESLAEHANCGLLMPQIITPGILLHKQAPENNTPGQLENELIWNHVATQAAESGEFEQLFPRAQSGKSYSGSSFCRLRLELAAGGFSIADAAEHLGSRGPQLAELEKLYLQELNNRGFDDPLQADLAATQAIDFAADVDKIILAGLTDIPRLLKQKLENIERTYPGKIEVWIQAEYSDSDLFDEFGSAIAEKWRNHPITIPGFKNRVHVTPTVGQAAELVKNIFEGYKELAYDDTVVLLGDMTLLPTLQRELADWADAKGAELELYDPSGVAFSDLRLHKLGSALCEFIRNSDNFDAAAQLIREPDFLSYLCSKSKNSENYILDKLDKFTTSSFPDEFLPALKLAKEQENEVLENALSLLKKLLDDFENLALPDFLREFFTNVYAHRKSIDNTFYQGVSFVSECSQLKSALSTLAGQSETIGSTDKKELFELFWKLAGQEKLAAIPTKPHISVQGCLEIPYINHKNIIFCGVNNNCYPDKIAPTTFLTNAKRRKIGIRSDEETFSRAASHFNALCANAGNGKQLDMIVIRQTPDSTPLQPSPLFFSGDLPSDELISRAKHLYPEKLEIPQNTKSISDAPKVFRLAPELKFKTVPEYPDLPALSVTDFKTYISDPIVYFLQRVCSANDTSYLANEPDNALLGTLCHEALELLPDSVFDTAEEYSSKLKENLSAVMRNRFGNELPPLLKIVRDNLSQRLEYAGRVLFEESREKGFVPLETEYSPGGEAGFIPIYANEDDPKPAAVVKGKIDRIEYCAAGNLIRIIDCKTGSEKDIINSHVSFKRDKDSKQLTSVKFTNLQLPLYVYMLQQDDAFFQRHPEIDRESVKITCAYLYLPGSVLDTRMEDWSNDKLSLDEIMPFVIRKVCDVASEISKFSERSISEKANRSKIFKDWFLPDIQSSTTGISFDDPGQEEYRI